MSRMTGYLQLLPSLGQKVRRWPFLLCLLTVTLLGASPWLYSRFVPKVYDLQKPVSILYSDPSETIYDPFDKKNFTSEKAENIYKCLNTWWSSSTATPWRAIDPAAKQCPSFFHYIHQDLAPWKETRISHEMIEKAKSHAGFRAVILSGELYVEPYYHCFLTRAEYTVWGLLLLLKKFKGQVPDLEFVFNCEDRPRIARTKDSVDGHPVLFAYDSNSRHMDIPFPDWSFWGWSELLISPWEKKREKIIRTSESVDWEGKTPTAYWSGNAYSGAPHRVELMKCHHARLSEIRNQNWGDEIKSGKQHSKLENQCAHRYMIYTEGNGWSVSFKYIMSCAAPTLVLAPEMYDFFSRGLRPWVHYIPIRPSALRAPHICDALDRAVELGEANHTQVTQIGKAGRDFLRKEIGMENVYNYMFHLLREYAQLLNFQPVRGDAHLVTLDHVLCLQEDKVNKNTMRQGMREMPTNAVPCKMPEVPEYEFKESDWETHWP